MTETKEPRPILWYAGRTREHDLDLCPENLSTEIRLVIGILGACSRVSRQRIADATAHSLQWVNEAIDMLRQASGHPTIHAILEKGLPLDAAVHFPEDRRTTLRCKDCRQPLVSVPCARCSIHQSFRLFRCTTEAESQPDAPQCGSPTKSLPGSAGKIAVMQLRVRHGFSPFCDGDAELPQSSMAS